MLRVAFIDHAYHKNTKSADFFVDLLKTRFDVTHYYDGVQSHDFVSDIVLADFDIIVLWQTEYLAPFFLASGQRVVCVPMYDGVANVPDFYWHHMRQARIISFCKEVHGRVNHLGLTSLPVQYMKDPGKYTVITDYSAPRVVFWQRMPQHGIDSKLVRKIVGEGVALHVHNAPDLVSSLKYPTPEADVTTYFDRDKNRLAEAMDWGNVFVCPRYAEGIGMAMLEAMARGMIIVAHDAPTQNEYVIQDKTGFLIDITAIRAGEDDHLPLAFGADQLPEDAANRPAPTIFNSWSSENDIVPHFTSMGRAARDEAERLYKKWKKSELEILDFIEETAHPTGIKMSDSKRAHLARETELWHHHPREFIRRMGYWEDHGICLQDHKVMRKPQKKRMRMRQSWWFRGLRRVYWRLKAMIRSYRWIRNVVKSRLG